MHDDRSHPLLQQTPLSVNPFINLPKAPVLPPNYASIASTLPPSILNSAPAASQPELAAFVTSPSGSAAHPSTIIRQNKALLDQLSNAKTNAAAQVSAWEQAIKDRELQEKRRTAPGWLDSESKLLEPQRLNAPKEMPNLLDTPASTAVQEKDVDDLGSAMDRAFGRSEMG